MNNKYKIVRREYFNEFGEINEDSIYYIIKKATRFLGLIPYWSTITHTELGWGDCYQVPTQFKTLEDAQKFIEETPCKNVRVDGWRSTDVRTIECPCIKLEITFENDGNSIM